MKHIFFLSSITLVVGSVFFFPSPAFAQDYGLDVTARNAELDSYPDNVPELVGNVIGTALSLIAVIFFVLMVYGGFLWMTAHGSPEQIKKAQDTIIAAVIGIIVVLASYAITRFVFSAVNSGDGDITGNSGRPPTQQQGRLGADCNQNSDCEANLICFQGRCGNAIQEGPDVILECSGDDECPAGEACRGGFCVPKIE